MGGRASFVHRGGLLAAVGSQEGEADSPINSIMEEMQHSHEFDVEAFVLEVPFVARHQTGRSWTAFMIAT
jgi:hypothetical protein